MMIPKIKKSKVYTVAVLLLLVIAFHNQRISMIDPENTYPKKIRRAIRLFLEPPENELDKHLIGKGISCNDRTNLYYQAASATVLIESRKSIGAGVFISPKVIVTAAHVINRRNINVYLLEISEGALAEPGKPIIIKRVHRIRGLDLAFIVTKQTGPSWLQLEKQVTSQNNLMIVGHPKMRYYSLQKARIKKKGLLASSDYILFKDNEVFFGNSGGAIVGCNGNLVGIVSMMSNYNNSYLKQGVGINAHAISTYRRRLKLL